MPEHLDSGETDLASVPGLAWRVVKTAALAPVQETVFGMDSKERLIRHTQELLWVRGYVGTSPKAIQHLADVGQGSMYHHFDGKQALAVAAIERSAQELRDVAQRALSQGTTAMERIASYLESQRDILRGCRLGRLTHDPDIHASEALSRPITETFHWLHAHLADVIREGIRHGEFAPDANPDALSDTITSIVQGGYVLAKAAGSTEPFHKAVEGALYLLKQVSAGRETGGRS